MSDKTLAEIWRLHGNSAEWYNEVTRRMDILCARRDKDHTMAIGRNYAEGEGMHEHELVGEKPWIIDKLLDENKELQETIRTLRRGQLALAHDALGAANNAQGKIDTLLADVAVLRAKNEAGSSDDERTRLYVDAVRWGKALEAENDELKERLRIWREVVERNLACPKLHAANEKGSDALKANARGASYATAEHIKGRWAMWGDCCYVCGEPAEATDHVIPLAKGGTGWPANLRPICKSCNTGKKDGSLESYLARGREDVN